MLASIIGVTREWTVGGSEQPPTPDASHGVSGDPTRVSLEPRAVRYAVVASRGVWRSLVACFVRDEEVVGSNPATPTIEKPVQQYFLAQLDSLALRTGYVFPFGFTGTDGRLRLLEFCGAVLVENIGECVEVAIE